MSFEEYVRIQLDGEEAIARAEQTATDRDNRLPLRYYLSALEQGRYADYIEEYVKHVTPERLLLLYYEDIQKDAVACMKTICRFANIDPEFYTDFTPKRHNQSVAVKSDAAHKFYRRWRIRIRQRTHKLRIHNLLRWIKRRVDTVYNRLNTEVAVADELPEDLRTRLEAYYREDRKRVEALVGRPAPW